MLYCGNLQYFWPISFLIDFSKFQTNISWKNKGRFFMISIKLPQNIYVKMFESFMYSSWKHFVSLYVIFHNCEFKYFMISYVNIAGNLRRIFLRNITAIFICYEKLTASFYGNLFWNFHWESFKLSIHSGCLSVQLFDYCATLCKVIDMHTVNQTLTLKIIIMCISSICKK